VKRDGKYYLFHITWPRGGMRTQLVHRADRITGPYEGRVCLASKGVAQGTIVDTPEGDWWAFLFQDCGAVGRTPWLVPVRWEDGWPVMGVDGEAPRDLDLSADPDGVETLVASDDFDRAAGEPPLPLAWQWNHNPVEDLWSVYERPGWLRLTSGRVDGGLVATRNTLTQRTFGPTSVATTAVDAGKLRDGDYAGLGLLQRHYGFVGVKVEGDKRSIVMVRSEEDEPVEVEAVPARGDLVHLRAECDFRDRVDTATFAYSLDGESWVPIGEPLRMRYTLPHFMGYRFALFNFATKQPGGVADFDYFRVGYDAATPVAGD